MVNQKTKDRLMYFKAESLVKRLSLKDKKFVVSLINEVGLYLLEFYMSKSSVPQYEYSDAKTAQALGWTLGKTKDNRLKLEKVNLFKQDTYGTGEKKAVVTTIGKAIEIFREKESK